MELNFDKVKDSLSGIGSAITAKKKPIVFVIGGGLVIVAAYMISKVQSSKAAETDATTNGVSTTSYENAAAIQESTVAQVSDMISKNNDEISNSMNESLSALYTDFSDSQNEIIKSVSNLRDEVNQKYSQLETETAGIIGTVTGAPSGAAVGNVIGGGSTINNADATYNMQKAATAKIDALKQSYALVSGNPNLTDAQKESQLSSIHAQADKIGYDAGLQDSPTTSDGGTRKAVY